MIKPEDEIERIVDDSIRLGAALGSWLKTDYLVTNHAATEAIRAARDVFINRLLILKSITKKEE